MAWALLLLWVLLWILPDLVTAFIQSHTAKPISVQSVLPDQAEAGLALDCVWIRSLSDLEQCVAPAASQTRPQDQQITFVPVLWQETEIQPGQWDWTWTDTAVSHLQHLGLTPVLVLHGAPGWLRQQGTNWDRDDPDVASSYPHAFAHFAARTAQRYQSQVRFFQLDVAANVAMGNFPFAVSPVRYGQMVALAARQMERNAPDPVLLSAPLLPVGTTTLAAIPPEQWLARFQESQGKGHLDVVQWRPRALSVTPDGQDQSKAPTLLTHNPFPPLYPADAPWEHWWFTDPLSPLAPTREGPEAGFRSVIAGTDPPGRWIRVVPVAMTGAAPEPTGVLLFPEEPLPIPWRHGTGWALWMLVAVAIWIQAMAAFRQLEHAMQRRAPTLPPRHADFLVIGVALCALGVVIMASGWGLACLGLILLLGLAFLRPCLIWLILLAALPFDYIHANIMTPLRLQSFALSPAQLLALALFPVLCTAAVRQLRSWSLPPNQTVSWTVVGTGVAWLLLLGFCHSHRPAATRLFQIWELEVFPLYIAGLSWWLWPRARAVWLPLTALAAGIALFATISLLAWIISPWIPGPLEQRLSGLTFSPNHAAMILLRGFWLALGLASLPFSLRHWGRLHLALAVISGWALLLTFSRGALVLGMPVSLLVWLWWRYRAHEHSRLPRCRSLTTGIIIGVCGMLLGLAHMRFNLWERLLDLAPMAARWAIWQHTWDLWLKHPWFGQGSDGFYWGATANFPVSPWLNPEILHPHNVWLEILVRSGVAGLAGMLLLCVLLFRALRMPSRDPRHFWLTGAAGMAWAGGLAHGQVDAFWSLPDIAAMNLLLVLAILQWGQQKTGPGTYAPGPMPSLRTET